MSEADERRERYAAAIETAIGEWETGEPTCLTLEERVADAAMALADEEAAGLVAVDNDRMKENARLRAELEENTGVVQALRRQRDQAEATLARVRSALDADQDGFGVDSVLGQKIRAALKTPEED